MSGSIQHGLELVLRVTPELTTDTVSKSPVVSKVLSEEILELSPRHRGLGLRATFMLVPSLYHRSSEERGGKKNAVRPVSPGGLEVILALLAKAVTIHVRVPVIEVREPSFEGLFAGPSSLVPLEKLLLVLLHLWSVYILRRFRV